MSNAADDIFGDVVVAPDKVESVSEIPWGADPFGQSAPIPASSDDPWSTQNQPTVSDPWPEVGADNAWPAFGEESKKENDPFSNSSDPFA